MGEEREKNERYLGERCRRMRDQLIMEPREREREQRERKRGERKEGRENRYPVRGQKMSE